jgi:hypothetical protein
MIGLISLPSLSVKKTLAATVLVTVSCFAYASTTVITFDESSVDGNLVSLQHGTVINNQYAAVGVQVTVDNQSTGPDLGVLYNTSPGTSAADKNNDRDSDLTGPNWGNSNFDASNYSAGNALIIQENNYGCDDGVCNQPDDQVGGSNGGLTGYITFDLDFNIDALGFDLIDFQSDLRTPEVANSEVMLYDNAIKTQSFRFSDFLSAPNGALYGESSINRIFIDSFASNNVSTVKFKIYGTGAIDNLTLTTTSSSTTSISEPPIFAFFGLTLLGMLRFNRRTYDKRCANGQ